MCPMTGNSVFLDANIIHLYTKGQIYPSTQSSLKPEWGGGERCRCCWKRDPSVGLPVCLEDSLTQFKHWEKVRIPREMGRNRRPLPAFLPCWSCWPRRCGCLWQSTLQGILGGTVLGVLVNFISFGDNWMGFPFFSFFSVQFLLLLLHLHPVLRPLSLLFFHHQNYNSSFFGVCVCVKGCKHSPPNIYMDCLYTSVTL